MKCLQEYNVFFALMQEKILNIIQIDDQDMVHIAKKPFYTNQTEVRPFISCDQTKTNKWIFFRCVLFMIEIYFWLMSMLVMLFN